MRKSRLTSAELRFIKRLPEAWREGLERLETCPRSKGSKGQNWALKQDFLEPPYNFQLPP